MGLKDRIGSGRRVRMNTKRETPWKYENTLGIQGEVDVKYNSTYSSKLQKVPVPARRLHLSPDWVLTTNYT